MKGDHARGNRDSEQDAERRALERLEKDPNTPSGAGEEAVLLCSDNVHGETDAPE